MHTAVYLLNNCLLLLSTTSCISLINCGFNVQLLHWKGTDPSTWASTGFHSMTIQLPVLAFFYSAVGTLVWQFFHLLQCKYFCQHSCRSYQRLISSWSALVVNSWFDKRSKGCTLVQRSWFSLRSVVVCSSLVTWVYSLFSLKKTTVWQSKSKQKWKVLMLMQIYGRFLKQFQGLTFMLSFLCSRFNAVTQTDRDKMCLYPIKAKTMSFVLTAKCAR